MGLAASAPEAQAITCTFVGNSQIKSPGSSISSVVGLVKARNDCEAKVEAKDGASIQTWRGKLQDIFPPSSSPKDITVFQLGENDYSPKANTDALKANARALLEEAKKAKKDWKSANCFWVTPMHPDWQAAAHAIKEEIGNDCHVIDRESLGVGNELKFVDKVHYTPESGIELAKKIAEHVDKKKGSQPGTAAPPAAQPGTPPVKSPGDLADAKEDPRKSCGQVAKLAQHAPKVHDAYFIPVPSKTTKFRAWEACVLVGRLMNQMIQGYNLREVSVGLRIKQASPEIPDQKAGIRATEKLADYAGNAERAILQRLVDDLAVLKDYQSAAKAISGKMAADLGKQPLPKVLDARKAALLTGAKQDLEERVKTAQKVLESGYILAKNLDVDVKMLDDIEKRTIEAQSVLSSITADTDKPTPPASGPGASRMPPPPEKRDGVTPPPPPPAREDWRKVAQKDEEKREKIPPGTALEADNSWMWWAGAGAVAAGGAGLLAWQLSKDGKKTDSTSTGAGTAATSTVRTATGTAATTSTAAANTTPARTPSSAAQSEICYQAKTAGSMTCGTIPDGFLPIVNGGPATAAWVCTSRGVGCKRTVAGSRITAQPGQVLCVESQATCGPPLP